MRYEEKMIYITYDVMKEIKIKKEKYNESKL